LGLAVLVVLGSSIQVAAMTRGLLPPSTALPVRFVHSVDARKAHIGDTVLATTLQVVILPGGERLAKGTVLKGHVVDARAFHSDSTPYAEQQASRLSIRFDEIERGDLTIPVNLSVRALANTLDSSSAESPHWLDESDPFPFKTLIGGGEFSPSDKIVKGENGIVVAVNRRQGVFARLLASENNGSGAGLNCSASDAEQSVAIFAPNACGLYGFVDESMPRAGRRGSGTFTLESRDHSVKLYAGATALLEEMRER
jgi:hypothetical protein